MLNPKSLGIAVIVTTVVLFVADVLWATKNEQNELMMEFVRVPAGSFYMGSPYSEEDRDDNEGPVHKVQITEPFYMGRYEVTQAQWKVVMGTTVCEQRNKAGIPWHLKGEGPEYPIYYVSWEEAVEFCTRLGDNFLLPTEAEWEYACRAGSQTRFYYGDDSDYSQLGHYAWYYGNSNNRTHPVGQKKPNTLGLYDMYGNVSEWCSDWFTIVEGYKNAGSIDPTGPASKYFFHVIRGGSWLDKAAKCRSANRNFGFWGDLIGFRVIFAGKIDGDKEVLEIALPKETAEPFVDQEQKPKKQLEGGLTFSGIVRDEAGMPIDDVDMQVWPIGGLRMYAKGQFEAYKSPRSSKTERYYLLARHPERNLATVVEINEDANTLDVKLKPSVILTGKVVDNDGKALEGAIVGTALQGSDWRAIIPPAGMKTDAEGKFTFRALPIGYKYSFYARLLHYRPTKFEYNTGDVRDNRKDLGPILLARGEFSVSGVVVDAKGKPVPNVWVYCTGKDQVGINSHTDADGRFKADGIFEGQVDIMASIRGNDGGWLGGTVSVEAGATNVRIVLGTGRAPPPKGRGCFPAETDVWVNGTVVQISKVALGQTVGKLGCSALKAPFGQIEKLEEHIGTFVCRDLVLENGNRISVIDAHCFMLDSGQWIAAQDLRKGLRLKTLNGIVGIKSVTTRAMPFVGKVYNLKVKGSDQYMVGKDGVIVRDY